MPQPFIASTIKQMNRKSVFDIIQKKREVTRTELTKATGISAPTMLKIFDHFTTLGILKELGEQDSRIGRKANLFEFDPNSFYTIGVDYSGQALSIGLVNLDFEIKQYAQYGWDGQFLDSFNGQLLSLLTEFLTTCCTGTEQILGIGIGCPTIVDDNNIIPFAPMVGITAPVDMNSQLEKISHQLGLPVLIENDTNAAAKGEFEYRKLAQSASLVFLSLKRGLGAGLVMNGEIWKGADNLAGEIGYLVFDEQFRSDISKPGWMEEQFIHDILQTGHASEDSILFYCAKATTAQRKEIGTALSGNIALTIANLAAVLNINRFVIGGEITRMLGNDFIAVVNEKVSLLAVSPLNITIESSLNPVISGMGAIVTGAEMMRFFI